MNKPLRLGFIGLGAMGFPMASQLISKSPKGSVLHIFDVSEDAMQTFVDRHDEFSVLSCRSPKDVSSKADIIFTMLPEGKHVMSVYLDDENGILHPEMSARLLIDCSTIDTATFRKVEREVKSRDQTSSFIDAPVSGGTLGAEAASLTFMVGCADGGSDNHATLLHLLSFMGKNIVPCGGPSMGLTAKLCNNYCSGLISLATAEAMNIGIRSGMDPRTLARIFASSTAQSTVCDKWNPVPGICPDAPSSSGYRGGFKVQLMAKDFGLAMNAARMVDAKVILGGAGLEAYRGASEDPRCRDLDSRVLYRYIGGREDWQQQLDGGEERQE